jgi:hypothetical protein
MYLELRIAAVTSGIEASTVASMGAGLPFVANDGVCGCTRRDVERSTRPALIHVATAAKFDSPCPRLRREKPPTIESVDETYRVARDPKFSDGRTLAEGASVCKFADHRAEATWCSATH